MANDSSQLQGQLAKILLDSQRAYYEELSTNWRHIESKAQELVTYSGVFIAAIVAFTSASETLSNCMMITAIAALLLLIGSVACALFAVQVRSVADNPAGDMKQFIEDLKTSPELTPDHLLALLEEESQAWETTNDEIKQENDRKATWLLWGQRSLAIAMVVAIFLLILVIMQMNEGT